MKRTRDGSISHSVEMSKRCFGRSNSSVSALEFSEMFGGSACLGRP
ncbi:hypothetical protein TcasGA2_TC032533 [Tribolium castaneum]|uniref:Uncharacterized protein n=1 Tax=Tribolium castaneum TaxID=7070 RepID=A0A139WL14_TRICA|nr:hypothetical protein TcasGA2_TC032533 [Tribolium castaneum]